jgi:hypothetical protein
MQMKYGNRNSARLGQVVKEAQALHDRSGFTSVTTTTRPYRDGCDPLWMAAQFKKHEVLQ